MKIVIDISEKIYREAIESGYSHLYDEEVANAVADGIPLPADTDLNDVKPIGLYECTPLIHCKDCKHFFHVKDKEDTGLCDNHGGFFTSVDGFCSGAEAKGSDS